ncbi:MAG: ribosome biogenesis GTPase Der [Bdellovibrionales bacterium]|nr:ribosome biogenesis GTPase Der [Bdellovibrionales bacterium]
MSTERETSSKELTLLIVGRPNVGKSTLFNRLAGRKQALVLDVPGVTRDRNEARVSWRVNDQPYTVRLVDTGGLAGELFDEEIAAQVAAGMREADLILAVFDGRAGYIPQDAEALERVRRQPEFTGVPVLGIVNKIDHDGVEEVVHEFHASGLDELMTVSAEHGRGILELQARVREILEAEPSPEEESAELDRARRRKTGSLVPRIAVLGRPHVGKSTLVNALLGRERMITSPMAGTTIDSVDSEVELDGHPYVLVDTAGIRRKSKTEQGVEVLSVVLARKALDRADIALFVVDAEAGISDQDAKVAGLCDAAGTSVVILVNKWDLKESKPGASRKAAAEQVRQGLKFLSWAPVVFTSGLKREGLEGLGDLIHDVLEQKAAKVSSRDLTEWMREQLLIRNPSGARLFFAHQSGTHPPTFVGHVNDPRKVHFSMERNFINGIRERWGYMGSPVRLKFQASKARGLASSRS